MSKRCPACGSLNAEEWEKCVICGVLLHSPPREALWWKVVAVHPITGRRLEPRPFSKREYAKIHVERLKALGYEARYFPAPYGKDPSIETYGVVEAYCLEQEGRESPIPEWSPREKALVADILMTEGCPSFQYSYRKTTGEWILRPQIAATMMDEQIVKTVAKLWGTKIKRERKLSRITGTYHYEYTAYASGTRALLIVIKCWEYMIEGDRTQRYRGWMLTFTIPYVQRAIANPRQLPKIEKELGISKSEILNLINEWMEKNRNLPTQPWRRAERYKLIEAEIESKPTMPPITIVPE